MFGVGTVAQEMMVVGGVVVVGGVAVVVAVVLYFDQESQPAVDGQLAGLVVEVQPVVVAVAGFHIAL